MSEHFRLQSHLTFSVTCNIKKKREPEQNAQSHNVIWLGKGEAT